MKDLRGYDELIEQFLRKEITVSFFERTYLDRFVKEKILGDLYEPLEWLFEEIDAYTELLFEPGDDPDDHRTEAQLRKSAAEVLQQIRALQ